METVGFIGIGRMGSSIARNIQRAGYPMVVYDVREETTKSLLEGGARLAGSPAELARLGDVTFTSLPGPKEVSDVLEGPDGILDGIRSGGVYVDLSTCGPDLIRSIEPKFRDKGARVLDAPVLSTPTLAETRHLTVLVGGEREDFERCHPLLDAFSNHVIHAGGLGLGCVAKLVNNMMGFALEQVIAEGLTLGVKAGLDLQVLLESGSIGGYLPAKSARLAETVFRGDFDSPSGTLALTRKDVALATELARQHNVPTPMASLTEQIMIKGVNRGWAHKDARVTFLLQEEAAAVEVRHAKADR